MLERDPAPPPPPPPMPAGWYPDRTQAQTQRYWDGQNWTDQTAPLAMPSAGASSTRPGYNPAPLIMATVGAIAAVIGCFLDAVDSQQVLTIANNSLIEIGGGWLVIAIAVGLGISAYSRREQEGRQGGLVLGGIIIAVLAYAASQNAEVTNGLGQEVTTTPAEGIYAVGVGGLFFVIAGLTDRTRQG